MITKRCRSYCRRKAPAEIPRALRHLLCVRVLRVLHRKWSPNESNHRILYRFSPDDYREITEIWAGDHPEDGSPLEVIDGPPEGFTPPDLPAEPQLSTPLGPDIDFEMFMDVAKKLFK